MSATVSIADDITRAFGAAVTPQHTVDGIPTFWAAKDRIPTLLRFLKEQVLSLIHI